MNNLVVVPAKQPDRETRLEWTRRKRSAAVLILFLLAGTAAVVWLLDALLNDMEPEYHLSTETGPKTAQGVRVSLVQRQYGCVRFSDVWGFVHDPARDDTPLLLGGPYASDSDMRLGQTVWSRDGRLVALETGERNRTKVDPRTARYLAAYDISRHSRISSPNKNPAPYSVNEPLHLRIKILMQQHGGRGTVTSYTYLGTRMTRAQLQAFPH